MFFCEYLEWEWMYKDVDPSKGVLLNANKIKYI